MPRSVVDSPSEVEHGFARARAVLLRRAWSCARRVARWLYAAARVLGPVACARWLHAMGRRVDVAGDRLEERMLDQLWRVYRRRGAIEGEIARTLVSTPAVAAALAATARRVSARADRDVPQQEEAC